MKITRTVDNDGCIQYRNERGQYHRIDGPAIERHNGYKAWYINGLSHREDGPAIIYSDGTVDYFLDDIVYSKNTYENMMLKNRLKRLKDL